MRKSKWEKNNRVSKLNEVNIRVTDKETVKNIQAYCGLNHMSYVGFTTKVFQQFFSDERTKLELMSKEQLIEVIMQWKSEK